MDLKKLLKNTENKDKKAKKDDKKQEVSQP